MRYPFATSMALLISMAMIGAACDRRPKGCPDCPEVVGCFALEPPKPLKPCDAPITAYEQQWALECITQKAKHSGHIEGCVEAAALIYRKCELDL